jgi:multimeric flavodoxin WrbA
MNNILGIVGSIRSNYKNIHHLKQMILEADSSKDLNSKISLSEFTFSNTDIAVSHALLGARLAGSDIELISVIDIFSHQYDSLYGDVLHYTTIQDLDEIDTLHIDKKRYDSMLQKVDAADGIVLGTPVYFGDRSSVANKFLQLTQGFKALKHKALGVVSCGAKRNGGQETANIYSLYEGLMQNAIVIGNGPKTAQYGGTVWAGDPGKALDDDFGLETSYGTGRQVSYLASILTNGESLTNEPLKITVVVSMDTESHEYEKIIQNYFNEIQHPSLIIEILNLINGDIYRCIACNVCPAPKFVEKFSAEEYPYHCIIQTKKDSMSIIQEKLVHSDCIVLVGVNSTEHLTYRYQAFMERTRFIRHDDFELTNIPIVGILINEVGAVSNPIFNVKVLTSFIRHNTFFLKPIDIILNKKDIIFQNNFNDYIPLLQKIKSGRKKCKPVEVSYKATGYEDKQLDSTSKLRL